MSGGHQLFAAQGKPVIALDCGNCGETIGELPEGSGLVGLVIKCSRCSAYLTTDRVEDQPSEPPRIY
jgi:hypothetical protein